MDSQSDTAVFVQVVEAGSFTAAAQALELSKGAVSKYVSRLEARLGARLLNRTTRKLTLTEAGQTLYTCASRALAELREAEREVSDRAVQPFGHLRVSAPAFYGAEILSRHLGEFCRRYPGISLEFILDNRLVNLVEERFDVAVRISAPKDSSLVMRRLGEIPILVCASPSYIAKHGRPETPKDLKDHECLIYTQSTSPREWPFVTAGGKRYVVSVHGNLYVNDGHVQRQAAIDGVGILRLPKMFIQDALDSGELIQLWPDEICPGVTLAVIYPSRQGLPAKVRVFVDFLVALEGRA